MVGVAETTTGWGRSSGTSLAKKKVGAGVRLRDTEEETMANWCEKNEEDLVRFFRTTPSNGKSFGHFVVWADTLPNPFGYWFFGEWREGVSVRELRAFWDQHHR